MEQEVEFPETYQRDIRQAVKILKEETARLFFGRKLNVVFDLPMKGGIRKINTNGTVVGVRSHTFDDYSVHLKFDKTLGAK